MNGDIINWEARFKNLKAKYKTLESEVKILKAKKKISFSKIMMACVMIAYFATLAVGIYAATEILTSYPEYAIQALIALLTYVGTPTGAAIGFYSWKAKHENVEKIKHENTEE